MLLWLALLGAAPDRPLQWLERTWCTDPGDGRQTCESWRRFGRDQGMRGTSVTSGPKGSSVETMQINNDAGRLVFHAEPPGQAATDFHSTVRDDAPSALEFVSLEHDYPQRVRYWREGPRLLAEISLADGSKAQRWEYSRVR